MNRAATIIILSFNVCNISQFVITLLLIVDEVVSAQYNWIVQLLVWMESKHLRV